MSSMLALKGLPCDSSSQRTVPPATFASPSDHSSGADGAGFAAAGASRSASTRKVLSTTEGLSPGSSVEITPTLAGPLRIQAPSSFGSAWLADAVARFSLLHPLVRAELFVDDALLDPIRHGFDLTIRVGGIPDSSALAMRPLAPCRAVLCASPTYLAQWGVPQTPQDLLQHQCLHFSHLTDGTHWHFQRGEGEQREEVGVRVQSTETASEISTAVAQQAELMRSADAGVNLDEEAARLIQFQQSYQAAAKVLQVAQAIFDTLLSTAAR